MGLFTSTAAMESLWDSTLIESRRTTAGSRNGMTKITKKPIWEPDGRLTLSRVHPTLKALYLRKLVLRPSSLTLLSESVLGFNLSRTERRLLLSSQMTVA